MSQTDKITFTVPGKPFGKQRPRHSRNGNTYIPDETRVHEQIVAAEYVSAHGSFRFPDGAYIVMRIYAYYGIPKSTSKNKRADMLSGRIRPTVKPDCDNIEKLIADALNRVAYSDDRYIVDTMVRKFYSDRPRTEVVLEEWRYNKN